MLEVANIILNQHSCRLHQAFEIVSFGVKYSADRARTRLLQIPLVSIQIGSVSSGRSFILLLEKFSGADYIKVASEWLKHPRKV